MSNTISTHSRTLGHLLWIFGFIGAHRFYFGKRKTGLLMALLTILGAATGPFLLFVPWMLVGVWWMVDFFLIFRMDRQADERYAAGPLNYSAAWLLLTFLGAFGAHRFYQGKFFTGLLFFFTAGLAGLGWFYDFWTLNSQISDSNSRAVQG